MTDTEQPSLPATEPMAVTAEERRVVERMRLTPEQRLSERAAQEQSRLDRLPADVRQTHQAKAARLAAMTTEQRRVFHLGQHLVAVVRLLREETKRGVALADVLGAPDAAEAETLEWFLEQAKKVKAASPPTGGVQGGRP